MFKFKQITNIDLTTGKPEVDDAGVHNKPCLCCGSALIKSLPTWARLGDDRDVWKEKQPPSFHITNLGINFYNGHCLDAEEKKMPFEEIIHLPIGDEKLTIGIIPKNIVLDKTQLTVAYTNESYPIKYSNLTYAPQQNEVQVINFVYFAKCTDPLDKHTQEDLNLYYSYWAVPPKANLYNNKFKQIASLLDISETLVFIITPGQQQDFTRILTKYKLKKDIILHKPNLSNLNYSSEDNPRLSLYVLKRN